jgi:hypothetical protein
MRCLSAPLAAAHLHVISDDKALFVTKIFFDFEYVFILRCFRHAEISLVYCPINLFLLQIVYYFHEVQFPAVSEPMRKDAPLPYQDYGKQNSKMACSTMAIL